MCTKGSSSYASSSFARARSAARSRPNDPSFARPFDDAAAAVRDDAPARARDARARDARTRTASRIVARAAGRAVVIARALCTAHARRAAACEHAIASRSGTSLFSLRADDAGASLVDQKKTRPGGRRGTTTATWVNRFCIPISSIFSPRSFICDPRVVHTSRAFPRPLNVSSVALRSSSA